MPLYNQLPYQQIPYEAPSLTWQSVNKPLEKTDLEELDALSNPITAKKLANLGNVVEENPSLIRDYKSMSEFRPSRLTGKKDIQVGPKVIIDPNTGTRTLEKSVTTQTENIPYKFIKRDITNKDNNGLKLDDLSTIGTVNLISGINTLGNVAANVIGAVNTSKMRPSLIGYRAPVEAKLVDDNTEQIRVASEESIDKNLRGAQDVNRRFGRTVSGDLISKGISATNEMSGKLAEYRKNLEATNAQIENNMAQYNDQAERNRDAQNSQIQTQFEMQKSGLMSNAIAGISSALTGGAQSLVDNTMYGKTVQLASYKNDIKALDDIIENTSVADPRRVTAVLKKQELEKGMKEFINKTYGKVE